MGAVAPTARVDDLLALDDRALRRLLGTFDSAQLSALFYEWRLWARTAQLPPAGDDWTHWGIVWGRGAGKTRSAAEFVRREVDAGRAKHVALVGRTAKDVRDIIVEGESGLLAVYPPTDKPIYEPSKSRIVWPRQGAVGQLYTSQEPDMLRGPQADLYWGDEVASWIHPTETWDNLMLGLRLGMRPRGVFTSTPRPIKLIRVLLGRDRDDPQPAGVVLAPRVSTYENIAHLAPAFIHTVIQKYAGTRLGRQELYGELLLDVPGALWTLAMIDDQRLPIERQADCLAMCTRVVVAIDPAVTSGEDAAETGIITVGRDNRQPQPHFYVFDDRSGRMPAYRWAHRAVNAYADFSGDRVVGEVNNGGDLIEAQLRIVAPNLPYKTVHASRGKIKRAEPVAALYSQKRVHHIGAFDALEDQMIMWVPDQLDEIMTDRGDALVWALTELMTVHEPEPLPPSRSTRSLR